MYTTGDSINTFVYLSPFIQLLEFIMWDLQKPIYQAIALPFIFNLYLFELLLNTIIISIIFNFLQDGVYLITKNILNENYYYFKPAFKILTDLFYNFIISYCFYNFFLTQNFFATLYLINLIFIKKDVYNIKSNNYYFEIYYKIDYRDKLNPLNLI